MATLRAPTQKIVIALAGYQFSGKTTVGRCLTQLFAIHHLDDDTIRHALFPKNSHLLPDDQAKAFGYMRQVMIDATKLILEMGWSTVLTSTFGSQEAKEPFLQFWSRYKSEVPMYVFRLALPETNRLRVVHERAIARYGTDADLLQRRIEGYERMRTITTPWPIDVGVIDIDASQAVIGVCREIIAHVPELKSV